MKKEPILLVILSCLFLMISGRPGPGDRAESLVEKAETLLLRDRPEEACGLLRQALRALAEVEGKESPGPLADRIRKLLGENDPIDMRRTRLISDLTRASLDLAGKYKEAGWMKTARHFFRQAEELTPGAGKGNLREENKEPRLGPAISLAGLYPAGSVPKDWSIGPDSIQVSPALRGSHVLASSGVLDRPFRISLDMMVEPNQSRQFDRKCGLAIGYRPGQGYYLVDMGHLPGTTILRLSRVGEKGRTLFSVATSPSMVVKEGWLHLNLEVRKGRISLSVDGSVPLVADIGDEFPAGPLGFKAVGTLGDKKGIGFRNIRLNHLPPPAKEAGPKVDQEKKRLSAQESITLAEKEIAAGHGEEAAFLLMDAEPLLVGLDSRERRRALFKRFHAALKKADPQGRQRRKLRDRMAKGLFALGKAYRRAGWEETAAGLLRRVVELKPDLVPESLRPPAEKKEIGKPLHLLDLYAKRKKTAPAQENWVVKGKTLQCVDITRTQQGYLAFDHRLEGNFQVDFQLSLGQADARAALFFGNRPGNSFFAFYTYQQVTGFSYFLARVKDSERAGDVQWGYPWESWKRGATHKLNLVKVGRTIVAKSTLGNGDVLYLLWNIEPGAAAGSIGLCTMKHTADPYTLVIKELTVTRPDPEVLVTKAVAG